MRYVWLVLSSLVIIFSYSFSDYDAQVGGMTIEKNSWAMNVKDFITEDKNNIVIKYAKKMNADQNITLNKNEHKEIKPKKSKNEKIKILAIGDSMAQGLEPHFLKFAQEYNSTILTKYKIGSSTFFWSKDGAVIDDIKQISPDLVLIVLGSNEWQGDKNPKLRRAAKKLVEDISGLGISYVWIGPPVKNAQNYNKMLCSIAQKNCVYDFTDLNVSRGKDKIHPTSKGFAMWSRIILNKIKKEDKLGNR